MYKYVFPLLVFCLNLEALDERPAEREGAVIEENVPLVFPSNFSDYQGYRQEVARFLDEGRMIELEDGTLLLLSYYDQEKVSGWNTLDEIVLFSNESLFSYYPIRVINLFLNSEAKASVLKGPRIESPFTKKIVHIDNTFRFIFLSDGSIWRVCPYDLFFVRWWREKDAILVACSESWKGSVVLYNLSRGMGMKSIYVDPVPSWEERF